MKPGRESHKNPIRSNVIEMRRGLLQDTLFVPSPHLAAVFQTLAFCSMINFELLFICMVLQVAKNQGVLDKF
jgi:hypothetical protein